MLIVNDAYDGKKVDKEKQRDTHTSRWDVLKDSASWVRKRSLWKSAFHTSAPQKNSNIGSFTVLWTRRAVQAAPWNSWWTVQPIAARYGAWAPSGTPSSWVTARNTAMGTKERSKATIGYPGCWPLPLFSSKPGRTWWKTAQGVNKSTVAKWSLQ